MPKWVPNCAADVPVRGARVRLVQEHQLHNWDPILASLGPGGPKNLRKPIKVNVNPSKTTKKRQPHLPNSGFRAQNLGLGQMWQFCVVLDHFYLILLGEVHTKSDHIWPKPIVLGPEPGVWAGCVHFKVF